MPPGGQSRQGEWGGGGEMGRWIGAMGVVAAALAALFLPMRESLAWGLQGHRVIALIALQQSDPAVRAKILRSWRPTRAKASPKTTSPAKRPGPTCCARRA